jgi:hypothetical protein
MASISDDAEPWNRSGLLVGMGQSMSELAMEVGRP